MPRQSRSSRTRVLSCIGTRVYEPAVIDEPAAGARRTGVRATLPPDDPTSTAAHRAARDASWHPRPQSAPPARLHRAPPNHPGGVRCAGGRPVRPDLERVQLVHERAAGRGRHRELRPRGRLHRPVERRNGACHLRRGGSARDPLRPDAGGHGRGAGGRGGPDVLDEPVRRPAQHRAGRRSRISRPARPYPAPRPFASSSSGCGCSART